MVSRTDRRPPAARRSGSIICSATFQPKQSKRMHPSPFTQTAVYMIGVTAGYLLLTSSDEWLRAWETVRAVFGKKPQP